jgi:type II secretory pathway pseudopilin PulG
LSGVARHDLCSSDSGASRRVTISKAHGFALIDIIFVCGMIGLLSSIAIPRMMLARQSANAASAIGTMRVINSAELTFALTCGSGFYAPNLTTLGTPPPGSNEPFISPDLSSADTVQKSNYVIQLKADAYDGAPASCNGLAAGVAGRGYRAGADAAEPGNTRFFGTNASATIYENTATLFPLMPEVGEPPSGHVIH